ncbi:MAG: tRNA (adenosine(37)-N6)-threonylcarbamoyltransferase complex ATPase subunit type 1 TsaE, partial [Candidatus Dormibacteraceae bacterium]
MTTSAKFLSDSAQATEDFGRALSRNLRRGDLLLLIGEMGSGKTTLVRGLAAGLGVEG